MIQKGGTYRFCKIISNLFLMVLRQERTHLVLRQEQGRQWSWRCILCRLFFLSLPCGIRRRHLTGHLQHLFLIAAAEVEVQRRETKGRRVGAQRVPQQHCPTESRNPKPTSNDQTSAPLRARGCRKPASADETQRRRNKQTALVLFLPQYPSDTTRV
jgi:hypothetical protein